LESMDKHDEPELNHHTEKTLELSPQGRFSLKICLEEGNQVNIR
jgi:hypothetical protein